MKISVCMAVYNGEKYIEEQLKSILTQLKEEDEVIVSDDGSSDRTLEIIKQLNDSRIQIFQNELEHGYTKNFENALNHAHGDIIFISDQDDVWKPEKVRVMCEALKDHELAVHDACMTDENLIVTAPSHFKKYGIKPGFLRTLVYTRYTGACMAFTKRFLELALPFPENQKLCPYDYWFAYLGELYGVITVLDQQLIYYRRHSGTALNAGEFSTRSASDRINTRIYCMYKVLGRMNGFLKLKKESR